MFIPSTAVFGAAFLCAVTAGGNNLIYADAAGVSIKAHPSADAELNERGFLRDVEMVAAESSVLASDASSSEEAVASSSAVQLKVVARNTTHVSNSNIVRGADTFSIKDVVEDWDSDKPIKSNLENDDPQLKVKKPSLKKRLGNHKQVQVKVDADEPSKLDKEEREFAVEVEVNEGGFVDNLPCSKETVSLQSLIVGQLEKLGTNSLDGMDGSGGQKISIAVLMKEALQKIEDNLDKAYEQLPFSFLLPQKVCSNADDNIPDRGESVAVDSCEKLDMLNDTDVLAFGFQMKSSGMGLCAAFNDATGTYAIAQTGIIPEIKIHALTVTIDAMAISINKKLTATTLNKMWDGTGLPKELTIPGHFVLKATGSFGLKLSTFVDVTVSVDTTLLIDGDLNNDGGAKLGGSQDYAWLLSGIISPVFKIISVNKAGVVKPIDLDLSSVFSVNADLYQYTKGNFVSLQLAISRKMDLAGLCDVAEPFEVFCKIFKEASFAFAVRSFASTNGFGIQFGLEAVLEFAKGFDLVEDLIRWPKDNRVSASMDLKLMNKKISACVAFQSTQFCTGKCSADADCDDGQACDSVFKVCREKRNIGGKCGRDFFCKSGYCVSGFCRECPNAGSSRGCPANQFCQGMVGLRAHVCQWKKEIGGSCAGSDSCKSTHCVSGFCRQCPNAGSSRGCPANQFCQGLSNGKLHVCEWKKDNGGSCAGSDSCKSTHCILGFCRECPYNNNTHGCPAGKICRSPLGLANKCDYICQQAGWGCSAGNTCCGGLYCTGGWKCEHLKGGGSRCALGKECASGSCKWMKCK